MAYLIRPGESNNGCLHDEEAPSTKAGSLRNFNLALRAQKTPGQLLQWSSVRTGRPKVFRPKVWFQASGFCYTAKVADSMSGKDGGSSGNKTDALTSRK